MIPRNRTLLRTVALFLTITVLSETLFPTVALALTSGPTTPEVYGHQPADATDNVSLVTGDFNYTIPITSIPEYPMAVGYAAQGGMDQDAGMFGFGVNGFTGAIARSMQGLPDDLAGGKRSYNFDNQNRWSASVQGNVNAKVIPLTEMIGSDMVEVGASASLMVGYDNFKGMFGAVGMGVGISTKIPGIDKAQIGGGVGFNSDYGFYGTAALSYGYFSYVAAGNSLKNISTGLILSVSTSGVTGQDDQTAGTLNFDLTAMLSNMGNLGISNFSAATHTGTSYMAPLPAVLSLTKGFSASLTVPITASVNVTGSFASYNSGRTDEDKNAFGFMYLKDYDRRERSHLADFTVENEDSYDQAFRNTPSYLQRDFFVVNSQGFSGSMQLFQDQYGVLSRNYNRYQNRNLNLIGLHTERKEVEAWTNASRSVINKQLDILKLLKKADEQGEKDFDKTLFVEKELKSITLAEYKFDNTAKFKMRGDLAGEFNLASEGSTDYAPNTYDLIHLSGTGGASRLFFLGEEKDMPLYYPKSSDKTQRNYDRTDNKITNSSNITYYTIGQLLTAYPADKVNLDPVGTDAASQQFNESFFSHHTLTNVAAGKQDFVTLTDDKLKNFNVLKHLKDNIRGTAASQAYVDNLIGDIRVKNAEGLTYVYNLPVFNHTSKNVQLTGKGVRPPKSDGTSDYYTLDEGGNKKNRNKLRVTEDYKYPYAWMLTAVVGPDYIDFDQVPGPSEGDLGYWVKFKYVKAADRYKWRMPYTGLEHSPLALYKADDDMYSVTSGEKEIYYVSEIESSGYVSKYVYQKRFDGVDAGGNDVWNGAAHNSLNQKPVAPADPTGTNFQYAVAKIELYKKHYEGNHSSKRALANRKGKLLKATEFKYDYSVCPNVPNNLTVYKSSNAAYDVKVGSVGYHVDNAVAGKENNPIGTGKLTLRKVRHISYEGGPAGTPLPSYELQYGFDSRPAEEEYNPAYDRNQVDQWGNYTKRAKIAVTNAAIKDGNGAAPGSLNYYNNYPEIDKLQADRNAQAFKLSGVLLPSGGSLGVAFEANGYRNVQDSVAYVMRQVLKSTPSTVEGTSKVLKLAVDITDLKRDGKGIQEIVKVGDYLYGELAFYESNNATFPACEDQTFISRTKGKVHRLGAEVTVATAPGRTYQEVFVVDTLRPQTRVPFVAEYKQYLYGESDKMKAVKESIGMNSCANLDDILRKYESLEKDGPLDAVKKVISNVRNYFKDQSDFTSAFNNCFGNAESFVFAEQSFIRTRVYKEKYTGSRVKSLTFADNFQYATRADGTAGKRENQYTTNYFYDQKGDGTGYSEGVATVEPGGGKSCVIDMNNLTGAGFLPSPSILSAKTTMETGYGALSTTAGAKVSRKKGKIEYHFFTPKDQDYTFKNSFAKSYKKQHPGNPEGRFFLFGIMSWLIMKIRLWPAKKRITIKLPIPVPLKVRWRRSDNYHLQNYAYTDQTDIYGKPKSVIQLSGEGKEVATTTFSYFGKNETVKAYNGSNGGQTATSFASAVNVKPGRMDQAWSEAHFTKESRIELIPWLLLLNAQTNRNFAYTSMKYTYLPPLLKEVITENKLEGTKTTAQYTGFDFYTGQPLESSSKDSYGNTKIQRVVPAYWKYAKMGPAQENADNLNMLTQVTGTYQYLNAIATTSLLGVGIVEWTQDRIKMTSGLRNTGKSYGANDFNYNFEVIGGDVIEQVYNTNGRTRTDSRVVNTYVPSAKWLSKPYQSFVYETPLKSNGTYSAFNEFQYNAFGGSQTDLNWKAVSTNTLFDHYGNAVESKDVLNKYAANFMGYHFSTATAAVGNASRAGAAYAGAENTYANGTAQLLDDPRVALADATLTGLCSKTFTPRTLIYNNLTSGQGARVLNICVPATPTLNVPFARMNVGYTTGSGAASRTLYVSLNENRDFKIVTDRGESFKGFYATPVATQAGCGGSFQLLFDPAVLTTFTLEAAYTNSGYSATAATQLVPACTIANVNYTLPDNDCLNSDAHTGKQAFRLAANGKRGTVFEVVGADLPGTEQNRKYKALVWVHNSSPAQTALVAQNAGGQTVKSVTLATPYLKAGNWSLLRLEVEPTEYAGSAKLVFLVQNNAASGAAIYDDFRVLPYQASMENYVYDQASGRITAKLDQENIATFFRYDARGRVIEVKQEVEALGPQIVKKYLYNEQKAN